MKKIALVTINDNDNYGNRLQNFAVYSLLTNRNYDVENVIRIFGCELTPKRKIWRRKLDALYPRAGKLKKIFFCLHIVGYYLGVKNKIIQRLKNFEAFNKNIKQAKLCFCKETDYREVSNAYDYFVTGSDQVWNPDLFSAEGLSLNMLDFTENAKKIAIAPSIATDSLSEQQKEMFVKNLSGFKYLSCREQQGADLLSGLLKRPVDALVDPTLMLSADDWDKVSKKPKFHKEDKKYILLYFLGKITENYQKIIDNIRCQYGLEVINILDKRSKYYTCGPSEFIYLIKHSALVLTDSFHGSVFSYIYDKPFRIFRRSDGDSMNSRLINLMKKLHLESSIYLSEKDDINNILEVSYDKSYLKQEQEKFNNYLDKVFKE